MRRSGHLNTQRKCNLSSSSPGSNFNDNCSCGRKERRNRRQRDVAKSGPLLNCMQLVKRCRRKGASLLSDGVVVDGENAATATTSGAVLASNEVIEVLAERDRKSKQELMLKKQREAKRKESKKRKRKEKEEREKKRLEKEERDLGAKKEWRLPLRRRWEETRCERRQRARALEAAHRN